MSELIRTITPSPHALRRALLALGAGLLTMAGIAALSTFWAPTRAWWDGATHGSAMAAGVQASLIAALATAVGALPVFVVRSLSKRHEAALLAFSAGIMLAASVFALLMPSLEAGLAVVSGDLAAAALTGFGLGLGVLLMLQIDRLLPHEHAVLPPSAEGHLTSHRASSPVHRAWLMVLAILIHNVPEGLAVGAAYAGLGEGADAATGASVALAIALQNMPEGLIVALALRTLGASAASAWGVAALTGLAEPLGAILGLLVLGSLPALYPLGLALAAGAMLFVVSHEIIPETHRNGHETLATVTLMAGLVFMLLLDAALG